MSTPADHGFVRCWRCGTWLPLAQAEPVAWVGRIDVMGVALEAFRPATYRCVDVAWCGRAAKRGGVEVWPDAIKWLRDVSSFNANADLIDLCLERDAFGRAKYGQPLMSEDGRDPMVDALQEALDLFVYAHKAAESAEARAHGEVGFQIAKARCAAVEAMQALVKAVRRMEELRAGTRRGGT